MFCFFAFLLNSIKSKTGVTVKYQIANLKLFCTLQILYVQETVCLSVYGFAAYVFECVCICVCWRVCARCYRLSGISISPTCILPLLLLC